MIALLTGAPAAAPAQSSAAVFAGTGSVGVDDGPRERATFIFPAGLAVAANGDVYVADAGAQRVRVITRAGNVRTVAGSGAFDNARGWVEGGYRDGPEAASRFNRPMGVAVAPSGAVYVADSANHCIRMISNAVVSTYAGTPTRSIKLDGRRQQAGFVNPVGVAIDANGDLFVADYGGGIRRITPDGMVSTVIIPGVPPTISAVSAYYGEGRTTVFAESSDGFSGIRLEANEKIGFGAANDGGETEFGHPASIAALSHGEVAFADLRARTVRLALFNERTTPMGYGASRTLIGDEGEDAPNSAGRTSKPPLDAPQAVAVGGDGTVFVADAGDRRIWRLPPLDRRRPIWRFDELAAAESVYRIGYVSNSYAFTNVDWGQSAAGVLEGTLNAQRAALGLTKPVKVVLVRLAPADITITENFIEQYMAEGNFDLVVWALNTPHLGREFESAPQELSDPTKWKPRVSALFAKANAALQKNGTGFLVAYHPASNEASWLEQSWGTDVQVGIGASPSELLTLHDQLDAALAEAHVDWADLFPAFWSYERARDRRPLYGTYDGHMSRAGNVLLGQLVADELERRHPWTTIPR